jgi:hypothetical protein
MHLRALRDAVAAKVWKRARRPVEDLRPYHRWDKAKSIWEFSYPGTRPVAAPTGSPHAW